MVLRPPPGPPPRFPLYLGLDLHGTLLDRTERIPSRLVAPLARELRLARAWAKVYVCTGNDMSFVRQVLPPAVRRAVHGYVLETGASVWERGRERALTPPKVQAQARQIQAALEADDLPGLRNFARRLTTVSAFTRDPYRRHRPARLVPRVQAVVDDTGLGQAFDVKYSSVAVDVVPRGYNKLTGLRALARGRPTVAFADSQNDWEFLAGADYAFVPRNVDRGVVRLLRERGRPVVAQARLEPGWYRDVVLRATQPETAGVLEALRFARDAAGAEVLVAGGTGGVAGRSRARC